MDSIVHVLSELITDFPRGKHRRRKERSVTSMARLKQRKLTRQISYFVSEESTVVRESRELADSSGASRRDTWNGNRGTSRFTEDVRRTFSNIILSPWNYDGRLVIVTRRDSLDWRFSPACSATEIRETIIPPKLSNASPFLSPSTITFSCQEGAQNAPKKDLWNLESRRNTHSLKERSIVQTSFFVFPIVSLLSCNKIISRFLHRE